MDDTFKKLAMLKIYAKHAAPFELRVSGNSMFQHSRRSSDRTVQADYGKTSKRIREKESRTGTIQGTD